MRQVSRRPWGSSWIAVVMDVFRAGREAGGARRGPLSQSSIAAATKEILICRSAVRRREIHVADPVALAARQAVVDAFAVERAGAALQQRRIHVLERVDVDHRIQPPVDAAG